MEYEIKGGAFPVVICHLKKGEKKTQDLTDKYCKEIDSIFEKKQKEIMEI